jgi:ABC-type multidrug transport system ATPase subunit
MYNFKVFDPAFLPHAGCEVEISLHEGELITIIGENGIGKTTLLKVIRQSASDDSVMIEQSKPALFFDRPLKKYQELFLLAGKEAINRPRFDELWREFKLSQKEDRMLSDLSGGEMQMLKLCLSLSINGKLYLLDEPSQNLDDSAKSVLRKILIKLLNEKRSILMVEHSLEWLNLPVPTMRLEVLDKTLRIKR